MSRLIVVLAIAGLLLLLAFLRPQESKLYGHFEAFTSGHSGV